MTKQINLPDEGDEDPAAEAAAAAASKVGTPDPKKAAMQARMEKARQARANKKTATGKHVLPERKPAGPPPRIDLPTPKGVPQNVITEDDKPSLSVSTNKAGPAAPRKPKVRRKALSKEQQALVDQLMEESMGRVDMDELLASGDKDKFYIPEHLKIPGWTHEWKTISVYGQPIDAGYERTLAMGGWQKAPLDLFRELVPSGYDKPYIELMPGSVLYIRPEQITEKVREAEYKKATDQLRDKMSQLTATPKGHLEREVKSFKREYTPLVDKRLVESDIPAEG